MQTSSEDLYGDSSTTTADAPVANADDSNPDTDTKTSILPKSFFSGQDLKPGMPFNGTIVAVHENDVEVSPEDESAEDPEEDEDSSQGDEPDPGAPPSETDDYS